MCYKRSAVSERVWKSSAAPIGKPGFWILIGLHFLNLHRWAQWWAMQHFCSCSFWSQKWLKMAQNTKAPDAQQSPGKQKLDIDIVINKKWYAADLDIDRCLTTQFLVSQNFKLTILQLFVIHGEAVSGFRQVLKSGTTVVSQSPRFRNDLLQDHHLLVPADGTPSRLHYHLMTPLKLDEDQYTQSPSLSTFRVVSSKFNGMNLLLTHCQSWYPTASFVYNCQKTGVHIFSDKGIAWKYWKDFTAQSVLPLSGM